MELLQEITDLFSPQNGSKLDSFGGTLATAIAAAAPSRQCFIVKKEKDCFDAALRRLDQRASRITSIGSGGLDNCGLDEYKTENIPPRQDKFE